MNTQIVSAYTHVSLHCYTISTIPAQNVLGDFCCIHFVYTWGCQQWKFCQAEFLAKLIKCYFFLINKAFDTVKGTPRVFGGASRVWE